MLLNIYYICATFVNMSKQIDISELFEYKKKLKKIPFEKLVELEELFPYADTIDILINKKHLKENGNLSLLQMANLVKKNNNPGLALATVIDGGKFINQDIKDSRKKKKAKKTEKAVSQKKKRIKNNKHKLSELNSGDLKKAVISEQLAEVYLKQGMKEEAIEMYKALSLQNPKKSAYFAKILKKIKKL